MCAVIVCGSWEGADLTNWLASTCTGHVIRGGGGNRVRDVAGSGVNKYNDPYSQRPVRCIFWARLLMGGGAAVLEKGERGERREGLILCVCLHGEVHAYRGWISLLLFSPL